jgi:hypothetical protein
LNEDSEDDEEKDVDQPQLRRSARSQVPNRRYYGPDFVNQVQEFDNDFGFLNDEEALIASLMLFDDGTKALSMEAEVYSSMLQESIDEDGLLTELHPLAFAAKANSEDTMNYHQAMNSPDADGFYKAMEAKLEQFESLDPWDVLLRSETEAIGANVIPSTGAFKLK